MTPADLCVVICAYTLRRWDILQLAVRSVLDQQAPVGELIVVIDHNDELLQACRTTWPDVRVLASTGQQGLSGARDTGWEAASGRVVAFLDDDAVADPDWSVQLAQGYADHDVIGVGGYIEPVWPAPGRPAWWPPAFDWVVGCSYDGLPTTTAAVRNVIGANMSVRREVLDQVGGFDSRIGRVGTLPMGCEETELYIRAAKARPGAQVIYTPAARVAHHVGAERLSVRYFLARCYAEGVSKAIVSRLATTQSALSTEARYATRTLPAAFVSALRERAPARAAMVVAGLAWTGTGYLRERVATAVRGRASA